ncbi:MAG: hypothetical protein H0X13_04945 [Ramlibacter sp.]|nr:hypothetical protein [Ramlibacter sp.]
MNNDVVSDRLSWGDPAQASLDASDDFELPDTTRYCPSRLLSAFALLMASQGRCINTSMMLGDREYAMWQLARAHTLGDAQLRLLAAQLFAYFDDDRASVPAGLHA